MHEEEALGEPSRVEQRLVDPHRVEIGKPRLPIRSALGCRVFDMRVESTDGIPGYAGTPQGVARQVGVACVAEDLTVDLEIGPGATLLTPESMFAERAVFRVEVLFPKRRRLDDVAVGVEHWKVFGRHSLLHDPVAAWGSD